VTVVSMRELSGLTSDGKQMVTAVADTLVLAYGMQPAEIIKIPAGTATVNFLVTDHVGDRWFHKVYRDHTVLQRGRDSVELAEFARAGQVAVPGVRAPAARADDLIPTVAVGCADTLASRRTHSPNRWATQAGSVPSRHMDERDTRRPSYYWTGSTRSRKSCAPNSDSHRTIMRALPQISRNTPTGSWQVR
jgi:hypothetical protein